MYLNFLQRLEFLGDSVLDILITRHLYQSYEDVDPGELTDLRSASVNNENFAQVAVRRNLQQHLQHSSGLLLSQITEYVAFISAFDENNKSLQGTNKGPKVGSSADPNYRYGLVGQVLFRYVLFNFIIEIRHLWIHRC